MLLKQSHPSASLILASILALSVSSTEAQQSPAGNDYPNGPPGVWAQIGDEFVFKDEVTQLHINSKKRLPLDMALDSKILEIVLRVNLKKEGITATKEEVDKAYNDAIYNAKRNNFDALKRLKSMGITEKTYRRALENDLLMKKRLAKVETPEAIAKYFDENRSKYNRQFRVGRYLIKVGKGEKAKAKAERRARAIIRALENGADWDTMVRSGSEHPLASFDAGDLGWVIPGQARFDKVIERARKLKVGECTSDPLYSRGNYHIIKVTAERTPKITFDKFRDPTRVKVDFRRETVKALQKAWIKKTTIVRFSGAPSPSELFPK
ncbi:MAG: peptidylprolyl isomerase [Planctomycetota bacterium]|nr:peptidylprolyl isomerase [Planctomycetota bacterium]